MSDPGRPPDAYDENPVEPPEGDVEPMPLPAPGDEPLDEDEPDVDLERPAVTTTDDLLGTPPGDRSDDPRVPDRPGSR